MLEFIGHLITYAFGALAIFGCLMAAGILATILAWIDFSILLQNDERGRES